jgi:hypothetical protein
VVMQGKVEMKLISVANEPIECIEKHKSMNEMTILGVFRDKQSGKERVINQSRSTEPIGRLDSLLHSLPPSRTILILF